MKEKVPGMIFPKKLVNESSMTHLQYSYFHNDCQL